MTKRKDEDLSQPRPGDFLYLTVPPNRHISAGLHTARIESLVPKDRRRDSRTYNCAIVVNDLDFDDDDALTVHFQVTIYPNALCLDRHQCFLGGDSFPVTYRHEPNIERRLRDSLPKERLPYADS